MASARRRMVGSIAAAGLIVLCAPIALSTSAIADTAPTPAPQQNAEARASALPTDAKTAILRDLHISPLEFIVRGDAAKTASQVAGSLNQQLGADKLGGAWFDPASKKLKVSVTDQAAAQVAQAAGAETVIRSVTKRQLVDSQRQLTDWAKSLPADQRTLVVGVSTDQPAGTGVLHLQNTTAGKALAARLPGTAAPVSVVYSKGQIKGQEDFVGGEGYFVEEPGGARGATCSVGFNAIDRSGGRYAITAGHCAESPNTVVETGKDPNNDAAFGRPGAPIGRFDTIELSDTKTGGKGHDYSTIKIANSALDQQPAVTDYKGGAIQLTGVTDPVAGMAVCKSGRTSNYTCGTISQVQEDITVDYSGEGPGHQAAVQSMRMFEADYCSEPGDSGAAVIAGDKAVGINDAGVSGSDGFSCPSKFPEAGESNRAFGQALTTDILPDFADNLFVLTTVQAATITAPAEGARVAETRPTLTGAATRGATVTVLVDNVAAGRAVAGNNGRWSVQLPTDLAAGKHDVVIKSTFGGRSGPDAHSSFTVLPATPKTAQPAAAAPVTSAPPTPAAAPTPRASRAELANTGVSSLLLPIGVGALVLIGGGAAMIMRNRRKKVADTER